MANRLHVIGLIAGHNETRINLSLSQRTPQTTRVLPELFSGLIFLPPGV